MSRLDIKRNQILEGDATETLASLPTASVDCVITSPPYFRLRDYGVDGQLGLEAHVDQWVSELQAVLREIARVLVPTGSVWLNLGDAYSTHQREGSPRKSLLLGPERLAFALLGDGWIIRNKIVWAKTNTTPTSVADRLATKHEVMYLMTRSAHYYFDLDAIRVPHISKPPTQQRPAARPPGRGDQPRPRWLGPNSDGNAGLKAMHATGIVGHPLGKNPGDVWAMSVSTYRGAHFATYPQHLVERALLAGCPRRRCTQCRKPWRADLRRSGGQAEKLALKPMCACAAAHEPGLVLDPFMGSGTTALTARRLGRDWLGIELNPDYIALAQQRLSASDAT
jgi:site-specific DNA-methyltransferase (adenine-specific)